MTDIIPREPDKFKTWADSTCGQWPPDLQSRAYRAWLGLTKGQHAEHKTFRTAYVKFILRQFMEA